MNPRRELRGLLLPAALVAAAVLSGCGGGAPQPAPGPSSLPGEQAPAPPAAASRGAATGVKVLLVGLDGADWITVDRLAAEGKLPVLSRLKAEGAWAQMRSEVPMLSPLLWTTVATGRPPSEHGILDFLMWDADKGRKVPISSRFRKVKAFWNLGSDFGFRTTTIAWWGSWPAEAVAGRIVSDRLAYALFRDVGAETVTGLTWPPDLEREISRLRVRPEEIGPEVLSRYADLTPAEVSEAWRSSGKAGLYADRINHLREILASMETYHKVALHLLGREQTPIFAVYYEGIDEMGHLFGEMAPPRLARVSEEDYRRFHRVVDSYYERQDEMLGELLAACDPSTVLVLLSDHGFKTGDARPETDPADLQGKAAAWHRTYGIFLLHGGPVHAARLDPVTLYDVLPTVLYLLGAPLSDDLRGRPLLEAFEPAFRGKVQVARVESYERPAEGAASAQAPTKEGMDEEVVAKLRALGYLGGGESPGGGGRDEEEEGTGRETVLYHVNRGAVLLREGRFEEAADAFRDALRIRSDLPEALKGLATSLAGSGRKEEALDLARRAAEDHAAEEGGLILLAGLLSRDLGRGAEQQAWLERNRDRFAALPAFHLDRGLMLRFEGKPDEGKRAIGRALDLSPAYLPALEALVPDLIASGRVPEAVARLDAALAVRPETAALHHWKGQALERGGNPASALAEFQEAVRLAPDHPGYLANLGAALGRAGRYAESEEVLRRAYRRDPSQVEVLANLGATLGREGRKEEALSFLLKAEKEAPDDPRLLNAVGAALLQAGRADEARRRFERSIEVSPDQPRVREILAGMGAARSP